MLSTLARHHEEWIRIAKSICGNAEQAQDLVQEMYLKLHDCKKEINASYVGMTMKSIFLDEKRRGKKFTPQDDYILDIEVVDEIDVSAQVDFETKEQNYVITVEAFNSMHTIHRSILQDSYRLGLREYSRESGISTYYVLKVRNKLKQLIWQEIKKQRSPQDWEALSRQSLQQLESNLARAATSEKIFLM